MDGGHDCGGPSGQGSVTWNIRGPNCGHHAEAARQTKVSGFKSRNQSSAAFGNIGALEGYRPGLADAHGRSFAGVDLSAIQQEH